MRISLFFSEPKIFLKAISFFGSKYLKIAMI
jgi:hypothetical protein